MVNGLERFRTHFAPHVDQYVLIGGTACTVIMHEAGLDFRATKDLDIVLYVEALHEDFAKAFWKFIEQGGYRNREHSTSREIFYRFSSPSRSDYPAMLELFSRVPDTVKLSNRGRLTPIPLNDAIASLSAILLDDDYYYFIHSGKLIINELSILSAAHLIPIKARAHIDLMNRKMNGENIDDRDVRKHKNDVIRLFQLLSPDLRVRLPSPIQKDFQAFLDSIQNNPPIDYKNFGIKRADINKVVDVLKTIYLTRNAQT